MRKNNTNITLRTAANLSGGTIAALRLGINELKSIRPRKIRKQPMPAGSEPLKLSVIICSAGIAKTLASAVKSALNQTASDDDYEVICVLNGANTSSFVSALPEKVILLHEMRQGISYARNCGANAARGEILLYIDDDALADSKLVQSMIDTFSLRKKAAVVGGQIFLTVPQPRPKILLYGRENLWSAYTVPYKGYREVREQYAFPYGACFAVRKSVLEKLGGFCESYGRVGNDYGGGEETALCFAALKNGWRIGIQPKAHVIHNVDPKRFCRLHVKKP